LVAFVSKSSNAVQSFFASLNNNDKSNSMYMQRTNFSFAVVSSLIR